VTTVSSPDQSTQEAVTYLYLLEQDLSPLGLDRKMYKIGVTRLLTRRLQNLQTGAVVPITVHAVLEIGDKKETYRIERFLHNKFQDKVGPAGNEWFALSPEDVEHVKSFGKENQDVF
jgi:hypothetical protein